MEIDTIFYNPEFDWFVVILKNRERWTIPAKVIPPETDIVDFIKEVISDARS